LALGYRTPRRFRVARPVFRAHLLFGFMLPSKLTLRPLRVAFTS
jgi:hypothetical protein